MRTKHHYESMLDKNPDASIGFTLAADMIYAARHGAVTPEDRGTDEWKNIARMLKKRYGENLTVEKVRHEMSPTKTAAAILGRRGGSVKSERKTAAVRENAKKGGRPPRMIDESIFQGVREFETPEGIRVRAMQDGEQWNIYYQVDGAFVMQGSIRVGGKGAPGQIWKRWLATIAPEK